jgi:NTE family protein
MAVNHLITKDYKLGLVLSGGGGKGAYQVGVAHCLSDLGVQVDAIAGTSIGALNGAILAAAPSLREGANRLKELWLELADAPPDELKLANALISLAQDNKPKLNSSGRLEDLLHHYLDDKALNCGILLYVGVFKSKGVLIDLAWAISGACGIIDTPDSDFLCIQKLPQLERRSALLASAALPLLFEAQTVEGIKFIDGGIGGWFNKHGNTPITPLIHDAGCQFIIVNHLSDGSTWNRHAFPEVTCIEIRPKNPIFRIGKLADTLTFDKLTYNEWMQQGYEDTKRCLEKAAKSVKIVHMGHAARQARDEALKQLLKTEK